MTGAVQRQLARALAIAVLAAACGGAWAQPTGGAARDLRVETIRDRMAAVEARRDIDEATRARIAGVYRQALAEIDRATQLRAQSEELRRRLGDAPTEVRRLERTLEEMNRSPVVIAEEAKLLEGLSEEDLDKQEAAARAAAEEAERQLAEAERIRDEAAIRSQALPADQDRIRATLEVLRADLGTPTAASQGTALTQANRTLTQARIAALQAQLELQENELAYQPARLRLQQLTRDIARLTLERSEARMRRVVAVAEQRRAAEATKARQEAQDAERLLAGEPTVLRQLVTRNAELSAQLAETGVALDRALLELGRLRTAIADLEQSKRTLERRAESRTLGREFAQTLLDRVRQLPKPEQFARIREQRDPVIAATNEANFRTERELLALADIDAVAQRLLAEARTQSAEAQTRTGLEAAIREQLARERGLLTRLDEQQKALLRALQEVDEAELDFARSTRLAREDLLTLLFWVPLSPISARTFSDLGPALEWTFSPANWRAAGAILLHEAQRRPVLPACAAVAFVLLLVFRGRMKRKLESLAPGSVPYHEYRLRHALAALGLTLLVAIPWPLVLGSFGTMLERSPNAVPFAQALGGGLIYVARVSLALYGFAWLFDRRGVAVNHFRWNREAMGWLQRKFRTATFVIAPLILVTSLNTGFGPHANTESLARLTFIVAMLAVALFAFDLFRKSSRLMRGFLESHRQTWLAKLRPAWLAALVAVPLGIAGFVADGYYFAGVFLFSRLMTTLLLVLVAVMLYGLIALWVLVQRNRLIERQVAEIAEHAAAEAESGEAAAPRTPALDIATIGDQTRQLLNLVMTLILLGGLWLIWRDAVPVLKVFGSFTLWSYTDSVDGEQVVRPLTLGGLFLAVLTAVVTVVAVRNIGALLDIVLLQRLELQADATYAIKTVVRYAFAGVGIVLATNILGVSWGKLQWLVAALGVGLGFGLQEIVANFVSGLIVLAERPIRIGDIVTVGDVSGTVSRIRARATSVIDFDNKEVIIPNKAFITERVVNWTLSNQTTRLLLRIGVAYGSDVDRTREVMTAVVAAHADVLRDPGFSVYFVSFGESALNFEVRAYVDSIDKRLRVQHELNTAIDRALRKAGIEIPFPQRDLHIRTDERLDELLPPVAAAPKAT